MNASVNSLNSLFIIEYYMNLKWFELKNRMKYIQ